MRLTEQAIRHAVLDALLKRDEYERITRERSYLRPPLSAADVADDVVRRLTDPSLTTEPSQKEEA